MPGSGSRVFGKTAVARTKIWFAGTTSAASSILPRAGLLPLQPENCGDGQRDQAMRGVVLLSARSSTAHCRFPNSRERNCTNPLRADVLAEPFSGKVAQAGCPGVSERYRVVRQWVDNSRGNQLVRGMRDERGGSLRFFSDWTSIDRTPEPESEIR